MSEKAALFYEQATPVSAERHDTLGIEADESYAFARHANSVPVTTVEFARASREYPIVFASGDGGTMPLAVLGLEDRQNLMITDDGGWCGTYVPAYIRRYPFVFAQGGDANTLTVCLDESYPGCNREGRGERLFDDEGNRTPYLERVIGFLTEYQRQYARTSAFGARLKSLDLLEPVQANVSLNTGRQVALTGFHVVGRERLKGLSGDDLKSLAGEEQLELVYAHLYSLSNFAAMVDRLAGTEQEATA